VIMNAVAPPRSAATVGRKAEIAGDPLIGVIGRLHPDKGMHHFIQAASLLSERLPDARFAVIGDGPEWAELTKLAQRLGVADKMNFLGYREDAAAILSAMDVLVVPSISEGTPLVVLEAMQAGVPVVASTAGGIPEQIAHDRECLLVPPGDPQAIADAVVRLHQTPGLGAGWRTQPSAAPLSTTTPWSLAPRRCTWPRCVDAGRPRGRSALGCARPRATVALRAWHGGREHLMPRTQMLGVAYDRLPIIDVHSHTSGSEADGPPGQVVKCMDECGVEQAFMFAPLLNVHGLDLTDESLGDLRRHNDDIAHYCAGSPERLLAFAVLNPNPTIAGCSMAYRASAARGVVAGSATASAAWASLSVRRSRERASPPTSAR